MNIQIAVDNLKCGGCASSISKQISSLPGIIRVMVLPEKEEVDIDYGEEADIALIKQKLHSLGYPESGSAQGLNKITSNVKSYVSCAIGRISGDSKTKEDDKSHSQK